VSLLGLAARGFAAREALHAVAGNLRRTFVAKALPQLVLVAGLLICLSVALGFAALAVYLWLADMLPPPLAALAVAVSAGGLGAVMLLVGWRLWWRAPPPPLLAPVSDLPAGLRDLPRVTGDSGPLALTALAFGVGIAAGNMLLGRSRRR